LLRLQKGHQQVRELVAGLVTLLAALSISTVAGASTGTADVWGSQAGAPISTTPQAVTYPGAVSNIQASNSDSYALANGTEYAWGEGIDGDNGNGSNADELSSPVAVQFPTGTPSIVSIGDAFNSGYAVDSSGNAWSWGHEQHSDQCGNHSSTIPQRIDGLPSVVATAGGGNHTLWLTTSGTVYACGLNVDGELGDGTTANSATPVEVPGLSDVVAISAAWQSSAALTAGGQAYVWGYHENDGANADSPVHISGTFSQIYVGGSISGNSHDLALTNSGQIEAWGHGYTDSPEDISVPFTPVAVMAGGPESGAIDTSGNVWMWGNADVGNGGNGKSKTPVEVDSGKSMLSGTAGNVMDA
jgi:alpha-tubulin suppressor-like RCC1 family protein